MKNWEVVTMGRSIIFLVLMALMSSCDNNESTPAVVVPPPTFSLSIVEIQVTNKDSGAPLLISGLPVDGAIISID